MLNNQKCEIQPTFINLHPHEYSQEPYCYPFTVKLDKFVGSCNTLDDLSKKVCVPDKAEDSNLSMFNMITGINESKTLTKHISCKCIEPYEEETNFKEEKAACKTQNFYILLAFLLIIIALLIAIIIFCYLIKYQGKYNHLLPFHLKKEIKKKTIY